MNSLNWNRNPEEKQNLILLQSLNQPTPSKKNGVRECNRNWLEQQWAGKIP